MNRELTRREKILLLVLIVVVLVAGYCKLILIPINDQISSYRLNMEAEQTELDANQGKMAQMQKMQKAIDEIKAAGIQAIEQNVTRYTPAAGTVELRQAVRDRIAADCGVQYKPNQVVATSGAKHAVYLALRALVNPGD